MTASDTDETSTPEGIEEATVDQLNLDVKVESTSACGRHVTVTVSKEDVDRYLDNAFTDLMPKASVPGFRHGRAPRKLVENRFRQEITEQVKGSILMDSLTQVTQGDAFAAISEPDFDFDAIELATGEPLTFEFEIEVRPEFDLPEWKGMTLERPVREFTRSDVDKRLEQLLGDMADLVPHEGKVGDDDHVVVAMKFSLDGKTISETTEEVPVCSNLSFPDTTIKDFDKLVVGSQAGDKLTTQATISHDAANEELRGKLLDVEIEILDVKKLQLPTLDETTLSEMGGYANEGELRDDIENHLQRRLVFQQQRRARQQISALLTAAADWDLPQDMLRRQANRELERAVLELRSSGFSESEIRAHENELRQNSLESTKTSLKEHFILERIAEIEEIEDEPSDFEFEIAQIAAQTKEPVRRVRSRIEKQGLMDALRNQIIERKVIEKIKEHAKFKDVPYDMDDRQVFAVSHHVSGEKDAAIPVAKHGADPTQLKLPTDRS